MHRSSKKQQTTYLIRQNKKHGHGVGKNNTNVVYEALEKKIEGIILNSTSAGSKVKCVYIGITCLGTSLQGQIERKLVDQTMFSKFRNNIGLLRSDFYTAMTSHRWDDAKYLKRLNEVNAIFEGKKGTW